MLKRIGLTNFKSFVDETVDLAPMTLLVGANASGKSNLLDAIRFLQGVGIGMTFDEVLSTRSQGGVTTWPGIRGGAKEIAYDGSQPFTLETTWLTLSPAHMDESGIVEPREPSELTHSVSCRVNGGARLVRERLALKERAIPLWETGRIDDGRATVAMRTAAGTEEDKFEVSAGSSALRQLAGWRSRFSDPLADTMESTMLLDLRPAVMRGWGNVNAPFGGDGENFAGKLADHFAKDPAARPTLVDWLRELCAPEIDDIDFIRSEELGEVMLMLVEKGGKRISVKSISDGTLRFLGLFVALNVIDPGPVVLIEEIDAGLHPTRLRLLVDFLEQVTREREVQIIATTHSPTLLQWLNDKMLRDVIVFGRVPEHEGTIMRRLGDLPRFDEVVKRDNIDELFSTGWMEMAL